MCHGLVHQIHRLPSHSKLNIMNRTELQESYIQQVVESMDYKTMERFVYDALQDNLQGYSDEDLIAEVEEYYPELLEEFESV